MVDYEGLDGIEGPLGKEGLSGLRRKGWVGRLQEEDCVGGAVLAGSAEFRRGIVSARCRFKTRAGR